MPVYSEPAAVEAYNSAPDQSGYSTFVGEDLADFDDKEADCGVGGCKADCECPQCRHADLLEPDVRRH